MSEDFRHPAHAYLAAHCPDFFSRYDAAVRAALLLEDADNDNTDAEEQNGATLPAKYREMVVICMLALLRASEESIAGHIERAIGLGLTEEELVGALQAAYVPGGAPVLMHGVRSLTVYHGRVDRRLRDPVNALK